jgi:hypothetical protein
VTLSCRSANRARKAELSLTVLPVEGLGWPHETHGEVPVPLKTRITRSTIITIVAEATVILIGVVVIVVVTAH